MASRPVLADAGPLVAICNPNDTWHEWSRTIVAGMTAPMITCDAVISEVFFILAKRSAHGIPKLCSIIERGLVQSAFALEDHREHVVSVLKKYRDLPTSFADACLVTMADADPDARIFTTDSDFKVYRKRNRRVLPLIFPE